MTALKSLGTIVSIGVYALLYYVWLPTISLAYLDGFIFIGIGVVLGAAIIGWWIATSNKNVDEYGIIGTFSGVACVVFIILLLGGLFIGSSLFNATTMYNQIGGISEKSFENDVVEIDTSQIPVVDIALAEKLADKKLGEDIALGSQMKVGKFTNKQQVNGKLIYVAPLEYRGFFKWNSNKRGTTGYVVVSATNPNDVQLVQRYDDKEIRLKYLGSAYFGNDLKRHIRSSGYRSVGLTEYSFELDDTGKPYWVVTTYENSTLWGNPEATGVVVCDAQSGACQWYSMMEIVITILE